MNEFNENPREKPEEKVLHYVSCRATASTFNERKKYTFREAIFQGWAEDGGMIMPEFFPKISLNTLEDWRNKKISYAECCYQVIRLFIPVKDISDEALHKLITVDAFAGFGDSDVVKNKLLRGGINVLELWHGPTLAFKDLGMQVISKLLQYYLANNEKAPDVLNLLVGTSGDTGSSAIEAVKNLPKVTITVLYPKGRGITKLQELQMTSVGERSNNVTVIGIDGTSDDLDVPMEAIFNDVEFKRQHSIGSVNSVNICRVLVQVAHYIWAAVVVASDTDDGKSSVGKQISNTCKNVHFYVPTGAGGHVTAGVMAKRMLCEMSSVQLSLHIATNSNDVFHQIIQSGTNNIKTTNTPEADQSYQSGETKIITSDVVSTLSPSMDIRVPYNLERLLWMSSMFNDEFDEETKIKKCIESAKLMKNFKETENIQLNSEIRERLLNCCGIDGSSSHNDQVTKDTILQVYINSGDQKYVLDPHTAIGVHAAMLNQKNSNRNEIVFCMACAHPSKFSVAIEQALKEVAVVDGTKKEKWWWLSDQNHPSVRSLIELDQNNVPVTCEEYKCDTDWENRLREHFVKQTLEKESQKKKFNEELLALEKNQTFRMARSESGRFHGQKKRCSVQ